MKKIIFISTALLLLSVGLQAASLSGQIFDSNTGSGISNAEIQLFSTGNFEGDSAGFFRYTFSDIDGNYAITNIIEGEYSLYVMSDASYHPTGDIIEIVGDLILNIPLSPLPGLGSITGMITDDFTNTPLENILLEFIPVSDSLFWSYTFSDFSGNYSVDLPAGQYIASCFQYGRNDGPTVDSLFFQYQEFYDDVQNFDEATIITVSEGETVSGIDFGVPNILLLDRPVHFTDILNGYYEEYLEFNAETGFGIINYIIIQSIEAGDIGDEIGILDSYGVPGLGNCDDEEHAEILVGAGVWNGNQVFIPVFGSVDDCENSGVVYPGFVEGNPIEVLYWDASSDTEYVISASFTFGSPAPNIGGVNSPVVFGNEYIYADLLGVVATQAPTTVPDNYLLAGNYPNPFNPSTTIEYSLPEAGPVKLIIFDVQGKEVMTLYNAEMPRGNYEVQWNSLDQAGNPVNTGVYFARLEAGDYMKTIKMLYLQ